MPITFTTTKEQREKIRAGFIDEVFLVLTSKNPLPKDTTEETGKPPVLDVENCKEETI